MSHIHDATERTEKALLVTVLTNLVLVSIKWGAYALTRSPSLFGEAAHASADALNPIILWVGNRKARAPAHDRHPLGHERKNFLWSFVAAIVMLFIGGVLTAVHGVETLRTGVVPSFSWIAAGIMCVTFVAETYSLHVALKALKPRHGGQRTRIRDIKNTAALAITAENGVDMLTALSALAGLSLYALTGNVLWDAGFSFLIAGIVAVSALFLIKRNGSLLVGESASVDVRRGIEYAVRGFPAIAHIGEIIAVNHGSHSVHCTIAVRWNPQWFDEQWWQLPDARSLHEKRVHWLLHRIEKEAELLRETIKTLVPEVNRVDITFL